MIYISLPHTSEDTYVLTILNKRYPPAIPLANEAKPKDPYVLTVPNKRYPPVLPLANEADPLDMYVLTALNKKYPPAIPLANEAEPSDPYVLTVLNKKYHPVIPLPNEAELRSTPTTRLNCVSASFHITIYHARQVQKEKKDPLPNARPWCENSREEMARIVHWNAIRSARS